MGILYNISGKNLQIEWVFIIGNKNSVTGCKMYSFEIRSKISKQSTANYSGQIVLIFVYPSMAILNLNMKSITNFQHILCLGLSNINFIS